MTDVLIRGGLVLTSGGLLQVDVRVSGGVVARVGPQLEAHQADVIDATDCWVGPSFVDLHAHFREPGEEHKEDIASGSAAAAVGGYGAVVAMPNTIPPVDSGHLARYVTDRGRAAGLIDVLPAGCISAGRAGERLAHLDDLWQAGVRIFTDDGNSVTDSGLLRRALEYVAELGGVIAQHAVDDGLAAGGHMHEGSLSSRLGMQGIPTLAEDVVIARDLALVRLTGAKYHLLHVATGGGVELVRAAKAEGLAVTAEVTPHHLAFDNAMATSTDPVYKMMPPLRSDTDVAAVRRGLVDGTIDAVATDHAPHAAHEKDVPFEHAPNGVIGLETAASVVNTVVDLEATSFFERMSIAPARIAQLGDHGRRIEEGAPANLVVFDPLVRHTPRTAQSRSSNSPFLGHEWEGRVRATLLRGTVTHRGALEIA